MRRRTRFLLGGVAVAALGAVLLWPRDADADLDEGDDDDEGEGEDEEEDEDEDEEKETAFEQTPIEKKTVVQKVDPLKKATPEKQKPLRFSPAIHEKDYPTPGYFFQVKKRDIFGGESSSRSIAYRALLSAGYQAAIDNGASAAEATTFARGIAKSVNNRDAYIQAIHCVAINDAAYGTWGYGSKAQPGPHGRAIRLQKYHADNRAHLIAGEPLDRNIKLGNWKTPGDKSGTPLSYEAATSYEFLLLPRIDLGRLWASGEIAISGWNPAFEWAVATTPNFPDRAGCGAGEMLLTEDA